jgi:phosphopantetheine--protein transferase-like protein
MGAIVPARVGIDLVAYEDVQESLRSYGERWARRVCTERELAACRVGSDLSAPRVALHFAAKEATMKVLELGDDAVPWQAIEVCQEPGARTLALRLHGSARALAGRAGLEHLRLDVARAGSHAAAVVVAVRGLPPGATPETRPDQRSSRKATAPMNTPVEQEIRRVLADHARLAADPETLAPDADLYQAGMTSHASVNVMLALEDAFDVEFPDRLLKRSVFESVASIAAALGELREEAA